MEVKSKVDSLSGGAGTGSPSARPDEFRKIQSEVASISKTVNHISSVATQQKSIITEIQSRVIQLANNKNVGGANQGAATANNAVSGADTKAMKQDLTNIKQEVSSIKQSVNRIPVKCPTVANAQVESASDFSCVSNTVFFIFALLQIGLISIFFVMQRQREQAAKKFF